METIPNERDTLLDESKQVTLGGIIKHKDGVGFKITFSSPETANKYKDFLRWIIINDGYPLVYKQGYYDMEEYLE